MIGLENCPTDANHACQGDEPILLRFMSVKSMQKSHPFLRHKTPKRLRKRTRKRALKTHLSLNSLFNIGCRLRLDPPLRDPVFLAGADEQAGVVQSRPAALHDRVVGRRLFAAPVMNQILRRHFPHSPRLFFFCRKIIGISDVCKISILFVVFKYYKLLYYPTVLQYLLASTLGTTLGLQTMPHKLTKLNCFIHEF